MGYGQRRSRRGRSSEVRVSTGHVVPTAQEGGDSRQCRQAGREGEDDDEAVVERTGDEESRHLVAAEVVGDVDACEHPRLTSAAGIGRRN